MSDADGDPELTALLADLTSTLQDLQTEVEPDRQPRLPTPEELSRFTSEVAIPGLILVLETNIRALQLLRRAIRLANGRDPSPEGTATAVRSRAETVGQATLSQLDGALTELQSALDGRPPDDEARKLLSRARKLQAEVSQELDTDERTTSESQADEESEPTEIGFEDESQAIDIDVESELQTLKDNLDDEEGGDADETGAGTDGMDTDDDGTGPEDDGDSSEDTGGTTDGEDGDDNGNSADSGQS